MDINTQKNKDQTYTWQPDQKTLEQANITHAIHALGLKTYSDLLAFSQNNLSAFVEYYLQSQNIRFKLSCDSA